jgi:hypothetical protein
MNAVVPYSLDNFLFFVFPLFSFLFLLCENNLDDIYGESVFHQSDLK